MAIFIISYENASQISKLARHYCYPNIIMTADKKHLKTFTMTSENIHERILTIYVLHQEINITVISLTRQVQEFIKPLSLGQ